MARKISLLIVFLFIMAGCSAQRPTAPPMGVSESFSPGTSGVLGAWELSLNSSGLTADLIQKRTSTLGESWIISGKSFFDVFPCKDCFAIKGLGYADGKILVDFKVKHPFPKGNTSEPPTGRNRLDLDLFDLALVVVPESQTPIHYALANLDVFDGYIVNPDGFTTELANMISNPAAMPYKLVVDDSASLPPASTYNIFEMGSEHSLQVQFPVESGETLTFGLYMTAGYGFSATFEDRLTPVYYNPEFNRKAAWKVEVTPPDAGNTWTADDNTTPYNVTVRAYDWQIGANVDPALTNPTDVIAPSLIYKVMVEIPGMTNTIPEVMGDTGTGTGMPDSPRIYNVPIVNENLLATGEYTGLVAVLDERDPEPLTAGHDYLVHSTDGIHMAAFEIPGYITYQTFIATVVPGTGAFHVQNVTPPSMNFSPRDIWKDGNYLYVAGMANGMHIFDISNPAVAPVWVGRYLAPFAVWGVCAENGLAVINGWSDGTNGMTILDVHDPANPVVVNSMDLAGIYISDFYISNGYAFCAASSTGMVIIDIDPPASASIVKTVAPPTNGSTIDVYISGNYAYMANQFEGLSIVDITDLSTASIVKTIDTFSASGVRIKDGYAYVTDAIGGLSVIDIEPLNNASVVRSLYIANGITDGIGISGNYAYVPAYAQGVKVIDISTPETADVVQTVYTPSTCHDVAISGNYAIVSDSQAGLFVLDIATPTSASISSQADTVGWGTGMSVDGDYAYVANYLAGLSIVDISDPGQPEIIKTLDAAGQVGYPAYDVYAVNGYAYLAIGNDGLYIIDVNPPEDANVVKKVDIASDMHGITVLDDYAYIASGDALSIVEISDPLNAAVVKQVTASGNLYDVAVRNGYAYTANLGGGGFQVFDVNPVDTAYKVATIGCANSRRAAAIDGYAFITGFPGMKFFDVDPAETSSLLTTYAQTPGDDYYGITIVDNYLYTGVYKDAGGRALFILDITDPALPSLIVDFPLSGMANDIEVVDRYAFLSHEQAGGFSVLKLW